MKDIINKVETIRENEQVTKNWNRAHKKHTIQLKKNNKKSKITKKRLKKEIKDSIKKINQYDYYIFKIEEAIETICRYRPSCAHFNETIERLKEKIKELTEEKKRWEGE